MLTPNQSPQTAAHSAAKQSVHAKQEAHPKQSNPDVQHYVCDTVNFSVAFKWDSVNQSPEGFFSTIVSYIGKTIRPAIQILFDASKINQLLSEYDHMVMQSKSPNVLVANYSLAKLNGLIAVLLGVGIEPADLHQRRRDIIKKAIEDNQAKFSENEYNLELLGIVSTTKSKKNRKLIRSLVQIRKELAVHMEKLGQSDWYTPLRQTGIQLEQLDRIHTNFTNEHTQTEYQLTYWHHSDATTGIQVRLSDFEVDSRNDLEKKKARLMVYFNKIHTRTLYLKQQLTYWQHANRITNEEAVLHQSVLGLKPQGVVQ